MILNNYLYSGMREKKKIEKVWVYERILCEKNKIKS